MKRWWIKATLLVVLILSCTFLGCSGNTGTANPDPNNQEQLTGSVLRDTSGAPSGVRLTWPRVSDTTVTGYHVYKSSTTIPDSARGEDTLWVEFGGNPLVPQVALATPEVTVDDLFAPLVGEVIHYRLTSVNAAGEESRLSQETAVTIQDFVITNITPTSAGIGDNFTIEGQYFGQYDSVEDFVYIPGVDWTPGVGFEPASRPATISNWTADAIDVAPSLGTTLGQVLVIVGGSDKSSTQTFVNSDPYITSINTLSAAPGTEVQLTGNNFGSGQDATHRVVIGGTELLNMSDYISYTNTSITFLVPNIAAAQYPIRVRVDTTNSNEAYLEVGTSSGPIWEHSWGETGTDVFNAVVTDDTGDVYLSGYTNSYHGAPFDVLLAKYDSDGNWQWGRVWDNTTHSNAADRDESSEDMCIDSNNDLYICGSTMDTGVQPTLLLLKYDSDGNHQFTTTWGTGTASSSFGMAVCCDSTSAYVAGTFGDTMTDVVVVRFNLSDGAITDDAYWDLSSGYEGVNDIVVDGNGDLIITGYTSDAFGASAYDLFVLKINTDLDLIWGHYWGSTGQDFGYGLYVDPANTVYVCGGSDSFDTYEQPIVAIFNSSGVLQNDFIWPLSSSSKFLMIEQASSGNFIAVGTGYFLDDALYCAVLGDTALDVLSFRMYENEAVTPTGLAGWLDTSSDLYMCGQITSLSGMWSDVTVSTNAVTALDAAETAALTFFDGVSANPTGTTTNVTGTLDTGGGGYDTLAIKYNPE
ncbi:IPT/TIG domain-containing protein [bacterium]|nr:IPT/TIG domain-containing protein [bacterium]